jgi:hypothetical protein
MKRIYPVLLLLLLCSPVCAQFGPDSTFKQMGINDSLNKGKEVYKNAFNELERMLKGDAPLSFKRAVYLVENAYFNNELDYNKFNAHLNMFTEYCNRIMNASTLLYDGPDKVEVMKHAAIYHFLTDTFRIYHKDGSSKKNVPFTYDFEDYNGEKNWSQMFVSKLITTRKGNCHSLPFLYKILAQELDTDAYLALAPNHIYIKLFNKRDGWYNSELTSGIFPLDAWLMASGYINLDAIRSGLYMDTLSEKQSVAICLTDLAQGYQKKFGSGNGLFVLSCCSTALKYFPSYINAMLLKTETEKLIFDGYMKKYNASYPNEVLHFTEAKTVFNDMEKACLDIHRLGYRRMPNEMYIRWLVLLKEEREKYQNKSLIFNR